MNKQSQGVAWSDEYSLGNEQVDVQHKKLFELVSDLVIACMDGSDVKRLRETLDFLIIYTIQHFHFEEELQLRYHYPGYVNHKTLHDAFKATVGELAEKLEKDGSSPELSNDVNKVIVQWLIRHILQEDKKIAEHIHTYQELVGGS